MYQLFSSLLNSGIPPKEILYYSLDDVSSDLEDLINSYFEKVLNPHPASANNTYVFLDEIQKVRNWENKIKIIYDLYSGIKFILFGSASLNVRRRSFKTLAGRVFLPEG
ncbi:AAA family ATPase [Thermoplasmatales archaeon AK]|nr:AAA family ATPase [Thermoplasmatales archaeon AK]